jgi:hypothetical protein
MTIAKLYAAPTITFRARWLETERALPGCGEPESMPMGSFAEEVATEAMRRRHRQRAEEAEAALPPLEKRPEWRRQQELTRQTTAPIGGSRNFKAGTWGTSVVAKRSIMNELATRSKYLIGFGGGDSAGAITKRKNEMNSVSVGDILHMKDTKTHYKGVVLSPFTSISRDVVNTEYQDIAQAAWGSPCAADSEIKVCDVKWTSQPLTHEMKLYLNKRTYNGGGCMKQCGTLIQLA